MWLVTVSEHYYRIQKAHVLLFDFFKVGGPDYIRYMQVSKTEI
jgi:hypothetical protein